MLDCSQSRTSRKSNGLFRENTRRRNNALMVAMITATEEGGYSLMLSGLPILNPWSMIMCSNSSFLRQIKDGCC